MINIDVYKVCSDCGVAANYITCWKRYGAPPKKACFDVSTFHKDKCDFCGRTTMVTETRDFFYPDFVLLKRAIKAILK